MVFKPKQLKGRARYRAAAAAGPAHLHYCATAA